MAIRADAQLLDSTLEVIELYILDASAIGGEVYYLTNYFPLPGTSTSFDGQIYTPMPISTVGWEATSSGTQPKPQVTISNIAADFLAPVIALGDLVGAEFTRIRTYTKHLDDGSNPDSNIFFPIDRFLVEQKTRHDNKGITWTLTSKIDRMGMSFGRKALKKDFPGMSNIRIR